MLYFIAAPNCKSIGIQTEKFGDSSHLIVNSDVFPHHNLSNKLLAIWSSLSGQRSGRDLVSKLFVGCSTDFHVLFGCLNMNVHSRITTTTLSNESLYDFALQDHCQSVHSSEVLKVSHLYTVLTKVPSDYFHHIFQYFRYWLRLGITILEHAPSMQYKINKLDTYH